MRVSVPVEIATKSLQLTEKEGTLLEWRRKINHALSDVRRRRLALLEAIDFPQKEAPAGNGGEVAEVGGASTRVTISNAAVGVKRKSCRAMRKGVRRG